MRVRRGIGALIVCVAFTTPASAATVNALQGQVLVNQGQGYQQVAGAAQANPGATIMVNPGGSAQVTYPDGCTVALQPGVHSVGEQSPCQTGAQNQGEQAGGGLNGTTFAIGAVVVGGVIGGALLLNKDKSSSP